MKVEKSSVSSSTYASAGTAYGKSKSVGSVPRSGDSVEVSASGSLFQRAVQAAENTPDIRISSVQNIQREFSEGSYARDETAVAERVIRDYLTSS